LLVVSLTFAAKLWAQDSKRLIRVKDASGRDTALLEKVVVISGRATLSPTPTDSGEPIEPWAIFYRIRNDDGSTGPVSGKLRVGDSRGLHVGWIGEKELKSWNTRFILDPIEPTPQRKFVVSTDGGGSAEQNATPEGKRRYALIVDTPALENGDDTEYPVVVYAGNVQGLGQAGTLARQRNELSDVKLEIMFVIESSDFMFIKFDDAGGKSLLDFVKDSIRGLITEIRSDDEMRKAVRLGFAEYKDSVPKASFTSRLTCNLTNNFDEFSSGLDSMQASKLEDDFPDDVLAGINEAVRNASWSENSVKHIILLGMASCQLDPQGQNPPQSGKNNLLEQLLSEQLSQGHNSTSLSISQLISRARPQGGADSRARTSKMLHALWFGRDLWAEVAKRTENDSKLQEIKKAVEDVSKIIDSLSRTELAEVISDSQAAEILELVYNINVITFQRERAIAQYREISQNNREADGVFQAVNPGPENVQNAIGALAEKIRATFSILEKVREGEGLPMQQGNEIAQPLFTLVGAAAEKFKDQPVLTGTAMSRDTRGREVAFKKVMVSEEELRRMRSTLDALRTKFRGRTSKSDRQDVGSILETLKEVIAETSAGQEIDANAKLKDLISDLPLRTAALDTTAADLALMTTEAFTEWLERIESAVFRIDDLLENRQEWLTLSDRAVNDRFTFLRLSELP
jgi:hypothetical protein